MAATVLESGGGHGTLNAIYAAVDRSCRERKWDAVDLLIIGGDFQSVRNAQDLAVMACPVKYRELGDFPDYYSGARKAPYTTIFIGGNHEASSHLWELYYGGWVAPNIYYMGAANVLRFGPLRIAGMSGIWKGFDYRKPHFERLPFNDNDVRSLYHVREIDIRKLLLLRTQVDIGLSHDWPKGIERHGDSERLFKQKRDFRQESIDGTLGNTAAGYVLDRLRPPYWFSAHLHVKFAALKSFSPQPEFDTKETAQPELNDPVAEAPQEQNPDEIDLDLDDDDDVALQPSIDTMPAPEDQESSKEQQIETNKVSEELLAQLPASFTKPPPRPKRTPGQPVPPGIKNTDVRFLALDKCLPGELPSRYRLEYDPEWLAITRVFHKDLVIGNPAAQVAPDLGEDEYIPLIDGEREWVEANIVKAGKLAVPNNFSQTAPPYEQGTPEIVHDQPEEYTNPQTAEFCQLLDLTNLWDSSEQERQGRKERGPTPVDRGFHGGGRGRGGGHGRGRRGGGRGGGRGRGFRGRW